MPTPADAQLVSTLIKDVRNPLRLIDTHFPLLQSEEEWRVFNGRLTKHVVCWSRTWVFNQQLTCALILWCAVRTIQQMLNDAAASKPSIVDPQPIILPMILWLDAIGIQVNLLRKCRC